MAKRLEDEVAVVTGSDSGIGKATAIAFAHEGADVAITYLHDKNGAEDTRKAVEQAGRRAVVVHFDQRKPEDVARLFDEAQQALGVPTILVNDAGIDSTGTPVKDMRVEDWDNEIRTNLYGPFYCCQQFVRRLEGTGKHGSIVNITSVHEEAPRAGAAGYDCAKGALRNLTRTLALELAEKNINVNNVAPGMVLTPFNQSAIDDPAVYREQVKSIPMKRAAQPEEIAAAAVYLCSPEARYVMGTSLYIDGALMMNQGQGA